MSNGAFDKDDWSFETKRDDKDAELQAKIKEITDNWMAWGNQRLMKGASKNDAYAISYNEQIAAFVDTQIKTEIAKLEGRYNGD